MWRLQMAWVVNIIKQTRHFLASDVSFLSFFLVLMVSGDCRFWSVVLADGGWPGVIFVFGCCCSIVHLSMSESESQSESIPPLATWTLDILLMLTALSAYQHARVFLRYFEYFVWQLRKFNGRSVVVDVIYAISSWSYRKIHATTITTTVESLKTDTLRDKQKCPSYRGVRLVEVIYNTNHTLIHWQVSVL